MKTRALIMAVVVCTGIVHAQTNFHTTVTNLWYQGHRSNVLVMAEARLAQNSNDIAGLILKMEYHCVLLDDLSQISNSIWRVIHVGDTVTSSNFVKEFKIERQGLLYGLDIFKTYPTPAQLPGERAKARFIHKPLPTDLLDALQADGYFDE